MELVTIKNIESGFNPLSSPNIMKLIQFRDTIAPTSAEAERTFSTMNRLKTPKRSKLSDERTSDLVLLSHEKRLTKGLSIESIIDEFATRESRRIPLL